MIAAVKARAAAKQAKASPEGAAFIVAARWLQKAQVAAQAAKDQPMDRVLETALAALSAHAVEAGLRMPQPSNQQARCRWPLAEDQRGVALPFSPTPAGPHRGRPAALLLVDRREGPCVQGEPSPEACGGG